jgi:hypothetical protein
VRGAQNVGVDGGGGRLGHAPDNAGVNKHVDVAALPAGCVQRLAEGLYRKDLHHEVNRQVGRFVIPSTFEIFLITADGFSMEKQLNSVV